MTHTPQIIKNIQACHTLAKHTYQRRLIALSGSEAWCLAVMSEFVNAQATANILYVAKQQNLQKVSTLAANKLPTKLGTECEHLIWNGFSGLNPDGLGIASGLIKGGGLFFLLLPELETLRTQADDDYSRMYSDTGQLRPCNTYFLQRLVSHLKASEDVLIFEEDKIPADIQVDELSYESTTSNPLPIFSKDEVLPSKDQAIAIDAIKKVSFGHRNRPLVIEANRGRGKSSALGIAAAQIYLEKQSNIIITAPNKHTCQAAFEKYKTVISSHFSSQEDIEGALKAFVFQPIDLLNFETLNCHLLLVDEAATIPTPILKSLLERYSRVVFSTTIHGYEGNGQGFAIRFKRTLDTLRPGWRSVSLKSPIRWQDNDPLETWFFRFLLLDADLKDSAFHPSGNARDKSTDYAFTTRILQQSSLFEDEALFEQLVSLLVTAHYQTSPSDIRLILDHPHVKILIAEVIQNEKTDSSSIIGVCLLLEEGNIYSEALAENIVSARRRPRGHLFPQAMCSTSAMPEFLQQKSFRVTRIAVHPQFQHIGIGSRLLRSVAELAKELQIDSISTSYGLSSELLSFWCKNSFSIVKLGSKVDGASGLQSAMMMRPISTAAKQLLKSYSDVFLTTFIFNLTRQHQSLSAELLIPLMQSFGSKQEEESIINVIALKKIKAFATELRPFEETSLELFNFVLSKINTQSWDNLTFDKQCLLASKVLQNRDHSYCLKHFNLSGKKQLESALRDAIKALLDAEA